MSTDGYLLGYKEIADYLGCAERTARYLLPIMAQYEAIIVCEGAKIIAIPERLDLMKLDLAEAPSRLAKKWKKEIESWRYRFFYTEGMQKAGIHVPEHLRATFQPGCRIKSSKKRTACRRRKRFSVKAEQSKLSEER